MIAFSGKKARFYYKLNYIKKKLSKIVKFFAQIKAFKTKKAFLRIFLQFSIFLFSFL